MCEAYLEKGSFFGRNMGARCSLAAGKGAQRGVPRPGRSGPVPLLPPRAGSCDRRDSGAFNSSLVRWKCGWLIMDY